LSRKSDEIGDNHPKLGGFDSRYHIRRLELTNCHNKNGNVYCMAMQVLQLVLLQESDFQEMMWDKP
jgi:hypothetical protein